MKVAEQRLALEKMRRDFVANVSHELRTPLTVVHGYLELLMEQTPAVNEPRQEIFEQMYQQTTRMKNIIEDLLLLSGLESDAEPAKMHKKIAMAPMLKAIGKEAKTLSGTDKHKVHIKVDSSLSIQGDKNELRSMVSNLVFNAVKYTPAAGHIYIECYQDANNVYLTVRDTGIGIAKKHIPRLTERFYRVDKARSRASGGTGLGLAIVKHVLIRHNGRLQIASELNKGSTFTCIFPL